MEFIQRQDGRLTEASISETAAWYSGGAGDVETFEAHLMLMRAFLTLVSSARRGRRRALSLERFALLRLLYRHPEKRLLMGEIARSLGVSPTSISKLVAGLARLRLVQRVSDPSDKRRAWAQITLEGERLMRESLPRAREDTRERWSALSPEEKRQLVHLLAKFLQGLEGRGSARPQGSQPATTQAARGKRAG